MEEGPIGHPCWTVRACRGSRATHGIGPLVWAIVLGVLLANVAEMLRRVAPGVAVVARKALRAGVVLLGLQVAFQDILGLGGGMVGVIVTVVAVGVLSSVGLGRVFRVGAKQALLIACGFSICGAAAVAAADGVVEAEEEEVATAIGLVVLFGSLMIPVVPLLGRAAGLSDTDAGLWAGAPIHEVAQVVAAGGAVSSAALTVAVVVKLGRVLMLAPTLMAISVVRRLSGPTRGEVITKRPPLIPLFVLGFLAMVAFRSTGSCPRRRWDWRTRLRTSCWPRPCSRSEPGSGWPRSARWDGVRSRWRPRPLSSSHRSPSRG
ncbi:putative sulfate exporter family transporter [Phycicoccus sp. M110.8]|uniref:YeiH family protein n=1 Tax=Phycicoccus sp. M110.8 TaxID=3075433 RepID=UPI0028FDA536|nr:putative sulfate exporter family transporter [Phycicoccus sp. M110.8]MDU0313151.1 putative sulfate exporter family transporter [Phycicoccus sp. M110.8]